MTNTIECHSKAARRILGVAFGVSAAAMLALTPTKASAFDIGGLIGTAMALQMGHYRSGYSSGGHSHHVASHDDSGDRGSSGGGERDARDPDATTTSAPGKADNRIAMRSQKTNGPSSLSGGIAQASVRDNERDAAAGEAPSAGRSFNDGPAFSPSR